jgi:hypothetical protein
VNQRPHVVNPARHWLTNWNTLPSQGWTTGNDPASERLGGPWYRARWLDRLASRVAAHPSFEGMEGLIRKAGTFAQQRPFAGPELRAALRGATGDEATVLRTIQRWNGDYAYVNQSGLVSPGVAAWQTGRPPDRWGWTQWRARLRRQHRPGLRAADGGSTGLAQGRRGHVPDPVRPLPLLRSIEVARTPDDVPPERAGRRATPTDAIL